jgi:hypothetical protein
VSPQAVSKALARGRIDVREDGWWDLFDVIADWRHHTRWSLQRARVGLPPWLDLDLPVTQGMVDELVRRARARGVFEHSPDRTDRTPEESTSVSDAIVTSIANAVAGSLEGIDIQRLRAAIAKALGDHLSTLQAHAGD